MNQQDKPKRLGLWFGLCAVGIVGAVALAASNPSGTLPVPTATARATYQQASIQPPSEPASTQSVLTAASTTLSNDNSYTNVDGNSVHSPADSSNGCVAAEATAECGDGTCSFSQHHSGTCSHHGGVAQWL